MTEIEVLKSALSQFAQLEEDDFNLLYDFNPG
jgi:hypothetical protein